MTSRPPSRLPLAFWLSESTLISGCFLNSVWHPSTRFCTAETGGPLMITTLPFPFRRSVMYLQAISPAWVLSEVMVASAPSAATSTATTTIPASFARFTAGPIPLESAALRMIMSTFAAMKLSICATCWPRSYPLETSVTLTLSPASLRASSSAPLVICTKNGLARSPTVTPMDFRSFACANGVAASSAPAQSAVTKGFKRILSSSLVGYCCYAL